MKNKGKQFELDFATSIPSYCFIHRLRDSAQSYNNSKKTKYSWNNECDFLIFDSNTHWLYAIECKSTKYKSMSVELEEEEKSSKMVRYHQIESLTKISEYDGVISGFCLNFRDEKNQTERTYFLNIIDFNRMMKETGKSSFNEMDVILYNGVKISGEKKRIHWRWDINKLLNDLHK